MLTIKNKLSKKAENLKFISLTHQYRLGWKKLISVSQLISLYTEPFDPFGEITARCAAKKGITPREQAKEWELKNKESTDYGTKIHSMAEKIMFKAMNEHKTEIILRPKNKEEEINAILSNAALDLMPNLLTIETPLYNEEYKIAGTPDLLVYDGKYIHIYDYKTNKDDKIRIDDNKYNKFFLPPLQSIPDNKYYHYALQLSLYRYMLEADGYNVDKLTLWHLTAKKHEDIQVEVPYLKHEILLMLEDYKKKQEMIIKTQTT